MKAILVIISSFGISSLAAAQPTDATTPSASLAISPVPVILPIIAVTGEDIMSSRDARLDEATTSHL